MKRTIIKGNFVFSKDAQNLELIENGYLIAKDNKIIELTTKKPEITLEDDYYNYEDYLITPGLVDLHIHAPQYNFRGLGMDLELLDWLNAYTFPCEAKFSDREFAAKEYYFFAKRLKKSATTRAVVFSTLHTWSTELLMKLLDREGVCGYVGKVNMDRNGGKNLQETTEESLSETRRWLENTIDLYENIKPIITPRFTPSCTDELMEGLGKLSREFKVPIQSHLSENPSEIEFVKELCPWSDCYAETYDKPGLLGGEGNQASIMAHCVYSADSKKELELLKRNNVFIAHSPQSNTNLASGIAPIRKYLNEGINVGLASDVAGGITHDMFRAMCDAISVSKLRWRIMDSSLNPLSIEEAFYLATKGGGKFFGKVGSFEPGYELDLIAIRDKKIITPERNSLRDRIERLIFLFNEDMIMHKFAAGKYIY